MLTFWILLSIFVLLTILRIVYLIKILNYIKEKRPKLYDELNPDGLDNLLIIIRPFSIGLRPQWDSFDFDEKISKISKVRMIITILHIISVFAMLFVVILHF